MRIRSESIPKRDGDLSYYLEMQTPLARSYLWHDKTLLQNPKPYVKKLCSRVYYFLIISGSDG
jgi:hypothetical protein